MIRKTYTILAVAFTTTACGGVGSEATSEAKAASEAMPSLAQELANTPLDEAIRNRDHFSPLCDESGYPLPGNVNPKQAPSKLDLFCKAIAPNPPSPPGPPNPSVSGPLPTPVPPTQACDRDALNKELSNNFGLDDALTQAKRFRCLCDDQGYPLVGNINSKGTSASAFCAALKQRGLL
jgi:hypothetical protein